MMMPGHHAWEKKAGAGATAAATNMKLAEAHRNASLIVLGTHHSFVFF